MPGFTLTITPGAMPPIYEIIEDDDIEPSQQLEDIEPSIDIDTIDSAPSFNSIRTTIDSSNFEHDRPMSRVDPSLWSTDPSDISSASWMHGVDKLIGIWIRLQREHDPSVTFEMRTVDNDPATQPATKRVTIVVKFHVSDRCLSEDDDVSDFETDLSDEGELVSEMESLVIEEGSDDGAPCDNKTNQTPAFVTSEVDDHVKWKSFEKHAGKLSAEDLVEVFRRVLSDLFERVDSSSAGKLEAVELVSDAGWSIWDYVPIIGSIRSLSVAAGAVQGGDIKGFVINSTVGLTGLALDFLTVSTGVAAVTGAVRMGAQLGATELAKGIVKGMATGAARSAAISGTIGAGVGGLQDGPAGALQGGLRGVAGGLVSGSLTGGSKGAVLIGQGAATASGMAATTRTTSKAFTTSIKAARVVRMSAKIAKKAHERKERASDLLLEIIIGTISVSS